MLTADILCIYQYGSTGGRRMFFSAATSTTGIKLWCLHWDRKCLRTLKISPALEILRDVPRTTSLKIGEECYWSKSLWLDCQHLFSSFLVKYWNNSMGKSQQRKITSLVLVSGTHTFLSLSSQARWQPVPYVEPSRLKKKIKLRKL